MKRYALIPSCKKRACVAFPVTRLIPIALATLLPLHLSAFGFSPGFGTLSINIAPSVTVLSGEAREFVFFEDARLSELDWEMKPLALYGGELSIFWEDGPLLEISGGAALPGATGKMTDRDWLNLLQDGSDGLTHFSESDADLGKAWIARAAVGWNFTLPARVPPFRRASMVTTVAFRYMTWEWDGNDGYLQHADAPYVPSVPGTPVTYQLWDESVEKEEIQGTAISYLQEYWMAEMAIALTVPVTDRLSFGTGVRYSPAVFCNGVDRHYYPVSGNDYRESSKWKLFFDRLSGGYLFEPSISASFRATDRISVRASVSRIIVAGLRGNTYIQESVSDEVSVDSASSGGGGGAELDSIACSLSLGFTLR